ncbi:50S ribosomal protein L7ae [Clostridiales bacterium F-3ap]|uniref:50S ribosomal protein L7ae n=2 Tax=Anaerotalea alkaliphila TaxID=2662126 RepID=A0A7X5KL44_9FIRM|nr:50S ribosomal protein L7ae [Anaerotalea alkaliphila]
MLGLCMKAGKLVSGEFSAMDAIKSRKAFLTVMASDASENTKKRFRDKCAYRGIPIVEYGDKEALGRAVGKEGRAVLAILEEGFATNILHIMEVNGCQK